MLTGPFRNILIIKPSAAGDIVCALPVPTALKQRWPDATVSWLVASHFQDLITDHPCIDQVIAFQRRRYRYLVRSRVVTRRFWGFLRQLRRGGFDLVIDLQGLFRSGFFSWATAAPIRIGPHEKREMGWIFYTHRLPPCNSDTHAVDRICTLQQVLDIDLTQPAFTLPVTDQARRTAGELLNRNGIDVGRPYAAIAPGGRWQSKRWPIDRFAEVARRLTDQLGLQVVVIGSKSERPLGEQMLHQAEPKSSLTHKRQSRQPIANLAGKTSLKQLLAILDAAAVLVTNDTGPMHMAAALRTPVVALFGPTNPDRTGPYRQADNVLQSTLPCAPCYKRRCDHLRCLRQITVEQVMEKIKHSVP